MESLFIRIMYTSQFKKIVVQGHIYSFIYICIHLFNVPVAQW